MAGEGGKGSTSRNLDQTPTWAVAGVCAVIIIISIALEKVLHKVGTVINYSPFHSLATASFLPPFLLWLTNFLSKDYGFFLLFWACLFWCLIVIYWRKILLLLFLSFCLSNFGQIKKLFDGLMLFFCTDLSHRINSVLEAIEILLTFFDLMTL